MGSSFPLSDNFTHFREERSCRRTIRWSSSSAKAGSRGAVLSIRSWTWTEEIAAFSRDRAHANPGRANRPSFYHRRIRPGYLFLRPFAGACAQQIDPSAIPNPPGHVELKIPFSNRKAKKTAGSTWSSSSR